MRDPHAAGHVPRDWSEAFAALPPETPSPDALSSVFARIPVSTPNRSGRQWWIAAAAVLALAAVVPFARHSRESGNPASAVVFDGHSSIDNEPIALRPQPKADPTTNPAVVEAAKMQTLDTRPQGPREAPRLRGNHEQKQIAKADNPHRKPGHAHRSAPASDLNDNQMEPLYAESARLEALLALARDDRVASATAVALGSDFEARLSGIDAALAQPTLDAQRRLSLWRDRVSALRAYASFESTQRALAASGERYDAMLVSID